MVGRTFTLCRHIFLYRIRFYTVYTAVFLKFARNSVLARRHILFFARMVAYRTTNSTLSDFPLAVEWLKTVRAAASFRYLLRDYCCSASRWATDIRLLP